MEGRKLLVPGENRAPQWGLPQPVPHGKFPGLVLPPELIPMICCHCLVPKPWPYRQTDIGKGTDRHQHPEQADRLTTHINSANIY